jgi:hypothetical protein
MEIARRKNKSFAQYTGVGASSDPTGWAQNKNFRRKSTPASALKERLNIHSLIRTQIRGFFRLNQGVRDRAADAEFHANEKFRMNSR